MTRTTLRLLLTAVLALGACAVLLAQVTVPYTFSAGTIIRSDEVNTNFSTVAAAALNRTGGTITGNINVASGVTIDGVDISAVLATAAAAGIPAGGIVPFNLASCPTGWTEYTAARGRYVVGLVSGATLAATVGTALTSAENRAAGIHGHTVTDPGHVHGGEAHGGGGGPNGAPDVGDYIVSHTNDTASAVTGLTVDNSTGVAGTNAPYIQLLMCSKNP
jgi:hypothetical protein